MGNWGRTEQAGTRTEQRPADTDPAISRELPAALQDDGGSPSGWCADAGLDAYIQHLVDAAPPLTEEQRDTLALLLRHPCRR